MNDDLLPVLEPLLKLMDKHDLLELEIAREGMKIRLKKKYEGVRKEIVALPGLTSASPAAMGGGGGDAGGAARAAGLVEIKSPMVGTFYTQQSPDTPPYVEVGTEVNAETVVCIIEAMKVFNEIKAEVSGEIVEILVGNSEPVEYGQPLFLVKPKH
ncbi:MAG: acetyl-CoA carboxylase biotin carboxyl carrier protein [Planctomycetota bacterium]